MTDKARIRIAAIVTALFLAGVSAIGLAAHSEPPRLAPTTAAAVPQQPAAAPTAQPASRHAHERDEHEPSKEHQTDD